MDYSGSKIDKHKEPMQWFDKHPLIATVLWALGAGHQSQSEDVPDLYDSNEKLNKLSWKDANGGSIAEYLTDVQVAKDKDRSDTKPLESGQSNIRRNLKLDPNMATVCTDESNPTDDMYAEDTCSPQYGFFVAITPPENERYHK